MPIHYVCVACREEVYLPDSKAGTLQGCTRCRLKFLAPAPNVTVVPTPGAAPATPQAKIDKNTAIFGLHSGEVPALFGSDEEEEAPGELFADAIPSAPDAELDEDLDVPLDGRRGAPAPTRGLESSDVDDDDE